jgi:hypothetical protein
MALPLTTIAARSTHSTAGFVSPNASPSTGCASASTGACSTAIRSVTPTSIVMAPRFSRWPTHEFQTLRIAFPTNRRYRAKSRVITVDSAVGNYVTLDLGHGRFALYAHLQPGSLRVKVGDNVKAGQALALIGNSGNSDAPHLHFQLTDGNSPMGSEGIPHGFETFTQLGVIDGPDVLDSGKAWPPNAGEKPVVHHREFPVDNGVVTFP